MTQSKTILYSLEYSKIRLDILLKNGDILVLEDSATFFNLRVHLENYRYKSENSGGENDCDSIFVFLVSRDPRDTQGGGGSRRTQCFLFNLLNVSVYLGFEPDILSHINTKHTFPVNIFLLLLLPIILYLFSFLSFFPFSASFFYYSPHYPPCISPYYLFPLFITSTLSFSSLSFHFSPHYPFLPNRMNPFSLSSLIFLIFIILFFFFFFFIILIHNPHFSFHLHPFFLNFLLLSSWVPGLCLPCILF